MARTDPVFLQYTSGSTGDPKGIMITDETLTNNVQQTLYFLVDVGAVDWAQSQGRRCTAFSWAPQCHDMGLVIMLISTFMGGHRGHYCSPMVFIVDPPTWVSLISKYKCHFSMAPDFAYSLIARKYQENPADNVDLSSLYILLSAGEPINQRSVLEFEKVFTPLGLRKVYIVVYVIYM